jgi:hypothetical protein
MTRRKLEELNLVDNFLIGEMMTHPIVGEPFVRALLKMIFQREFGKITVAPQKTRSMGTFSDQGKCI